jgi:hypothetical protein
MPVATFSINDGVLLLCALGTGSAAYFSRSRALRAGGAAMAILFGVEVVVHLVADHVHVHRDFYAIAAQVLPVLILALVIEGRFLARGEASVAAVALLNMTIGEAASLYAVATGDDYITGRAILGAAIGALLGTTVALVIVALPEPRGRSDPSTGGSESGTEGAG